MSVRGWVALALLLALPGTGARAEDTPSWFVPEDKCMSRPCACSDIPMMQKYLANQMMARDVFKDLVTEIPTATGPHSPAALEAAFGSRFMANPDVIAQFKSCPGYDPSKNSLSKVAGLTGFGSAVIDPCLCSAFCKDIAHSTIVHEEKHVPTILLGVFAYKDFTLACKFGILSGAVCDMIDPLIRAQSEVESYGAGIDSLSASLNHLMAHDPTNEDVACTWKAIVREPAQAPVVAPDGFLPRVELLLGRITRGGRP